MSITKKQRARLESVAYRKMCERCDRIYEREFPRARERERRLMQVQLELPLPLRDDAPLRKKYEHGH